MTERWQDDPARADRIVGRLAEVTRKRRALDATEALLSSDDLEPWSRRRFEQTAAGNRKGLDAAIGMALFDPAKVPATEIARAAGVDLEHVERVREQLRDL